MLAEPDAHVGHDVLDSPKWLLSSLDYARHRFHFVETSRDLVRLSPFLDGRTPISVGGNEVIVTFDEALAWLEKAPPPAIGVIQHVGFCGSTLLSRLLDATCACTVYREPQTLIELSTARSDLALMYQDPHLWRAIFRVAAFQFAKGFGERGVLKPSNWALNLMNDWTRADLGAGFVFITTTPEDYLVSILRGGAERVAFTLKFVSQLRKNADVATPLIAEVEDDAAINPAQRILRFSLIALVAQMRAFARAASGLDPSRYATTTYADIVGDPQGVIARCRTALGLAARDGDADAAIADTLAVHAKTIEEPFDRARQAFIDGRIRINAHSDIENALAWGRDRLQLE
jgi:hypothetical protein